MDNQTRIKPVPPALHVENFRVLIHGPNILTADFESLTYLSRHHSHPGIVYGISICLLVSANFCRAAVDTHGSRIGAIPDMRLRRHPMLL